MVVFVDDITISMGAAVGDKEDITKIEKFNYRETPQPSFRPITVMDSVPPISFRQGHKWVEGEFHVKSEANAAVHGQAVDYLPPGAEAPTCPYLVATIVDHAAGSYTVTFTGVYFSSEELAHGHGEEGITIYKFVALTVIQAAVV